MATNEDRIEVLLVEDSPSDAQLLCELLQDYPPQRFAIERAERLEEALGLLAERAFDVVLLDLTLPDSAGLETCTRMRRAAPHVPVVVLTGVDDETIALEAMRQGVEDYLVKGQIHGGTVGRAIRYAVERSRSELALRESEERYRTLFSTMSEGFALHEILCDGDGRPYDYRFLEVNLAFERQMGLKAGDLIGRTVREVLPDIEPLWIERYGRVALTGRPDQFEDRSGSLGRWYDVRAYQTVPGRFAVVFTDITERRQVEAVQSFLAQSAGASGHEDFFKTLARYLAQTLAADFVCIDRLVEDGLSAQTVAVYYDGKFEDDLAYTLKETPCGEVVGRTVCCFPRDVRGLFPRDHVLQEMKAEGYVGITLWSHQGKPIGLIALIWRCPLEDPGLAESLLQLVAVRTAGELERQRAEVALRESEGRLKRAQEIARLGSWELDLVHNRLTWSDEVYRIFGLKAQEFGATYEAFLQRVHPDDRAAVDAAYSGSLRENRDTYEIEHRVVRPSNGETRIVHEKCEHFRDASGRIIQSVGMVHDITERKRAEEQLRRLNRTLRALSDSSHALIHATEESAYLQEVCKIVVEDCGYAMVWIGYAEQDEAQSVRPVVYAGFEEGYLETLQLTWADTERGRGPTGMAIRTGQPSLCRNMLTDPSFAFWREQAVKRGYASSIVLPLRSDGKVFGAINIYSRESDPFSKDEVELLMELAADLAYGITSLRLRAAHARAEEAVRESEARLRLAQDAAKAGTWEWDLRTNENFWSEELWKLYGLEPHSCQPSYEAWRQTVHPDDRARVEAAVQAAARRGIELKAEWRVRDRQGEERWLMSRGRPVHDAGGQMTRYRGIVLDITERKQMEAELQRLNDQLEEEVQAQTQELKDTVDRLREEVARRVQAEQDLRKRSQMLEHRAGQLQRLTLELSQAEDRERKRLAEILHDDLQQQLAAAKFHLSLLGNQVLQSPATRETLAQLDQILKDAIEKSRSLSHELSPAVLYQSDLGETFEWLARQLKAKHGLTVDVQSRGRIQVQSEPIKAFLYKTAQEILFNVVKHARVKEARLRVQRMHGCVWLTISDQGRGFDPRSLGRAGGFGLLSIRERIELLGGRMKIRSAKGRGSTFLIAVPDGQEAEGRGPRAQDAGLTAESAVLRNPSSVLRSPSSALRVLLVDDHKVMREGLAALLNEQSDLAVVGQAGNGREAVDLAYQLEPDVVVMDAAMPLMAGDEATRQIKLHLPHVRVVALSMFEEADMAEAMRQAGAEAYLLKTAPSDELLAAIRGRS